MSKVTQQIIAAGQSKDKQACRKELAGLMTLIRILGAHTLPHFVTHTNIVVMCMCFFLTPKWHYFKSVF